MVELIDYKVWFKLAEEEFNYACRDLRTKGHTFFAPTCFHFHQAAEKSLKAYILFCGKQFRKIHNLVELVKICGVDDTDFNNLLEEAGELNPFYTNTRYPVHWPANFTRQDAKMAKEAASKIVRLVRKKISQKLPAL